LWVELSGAVFKGHQPRIIRPWSIGVGTASNEDYHEA
jgi:hypothetical protein